MSSKSLCRGNFFGNILPDANLIVLDNFRIIRLLHFPMRWLKSLLGQDWSNKLQQVVMAVKSCFSNFCTQARTQTQSLGVIAADGQQVDPAKSGV